MSGLSLNSSEEYFRWITESAVDAIVLANAEGNIIFWNSAAKEMFGYDASEVLNHPLTMLMPERFRNLHRKGLKRFKETSEPHVIGQILQLYGVRKNGDEFPIEISITACKFESDVVFSGIIRDATHFRAREKQLSQAQNIAHIGGWEWNILTGQVSWTPELYEIYGVNPATFVPSFKSYLRLVHPEDRDRAKQMVEKALSDRQPLSLEERIVRPDGAIRHLQVNAEVICNDSGAPIRVIGICQDVTDRHLLQDQLFRAQKIEAIGQLAGGMAHDFNNILMAIHSYCELLQLKLAGDQLLLKDVEEIEKATKQGAALTRQLLAFGRKQILDPKPFDLNNALSEMQDMLSRLIREDIQVSLNLDEDLGLVRADQSQIEQVILNLVVNARDAIHGAGKILIETKNVSFSEKQREQEVPLNPGDYVLLRVADTGCGMDRGTRSRVFEPFFTTKPQGKGTGLGLSTAYGIIKQSDGYIFVESELKKGSAFKIYLPRSSAPPREIPKQLLTEEADRPVPAAARGSILLVDDNLALRDAIAAFLITNGYNVLVADSGPQALEISRNAKEEIQILLTDLIMPGMNGKELSTRLTAERPNLITLYISGYSKEAFLSEDFVGPRTAFIQKPASMATIIRKLNELLSVP